MTFSSLRVPSLEWYSSFVSRSSSSSPQHPYDAFSTLLLPSLPLASQQLLLAVLRTIQPVVAHAQQNAMPAPRLCYLLGAYVFGLAAGPSTRARGGSSSGSSPSWDDFAHQWSAAGRALEGCLKAYLREQSDLPPRLQELIDDYPAWVADSDRSAAADATRTRRRTIRALKVEIESLGEWETAGTVRSNSQATGLGIEGESKRPARRRPVEVLMAAIGAAAPVGEQGPAESRAWKTLVDHLSSAAVANADSLRLSALDEETVRVLGLLGLDKPKTRDASTASPGRPVEGSPHRRTRSSVEPADFSPVRPQRNSFLSPSPSMPTISPRVRLRSSPSWQDFSTQGFAQSSLNLSSDLYDPSKNRSPPPPRSIEVQRPTTRMTGLSLVDVDEDLVSVWLDSLAESSTTMSPVAAWPCVLLTPLSPAARSEDVLQEASISTLLIVETLLPRTTSQAAVNSPPRPPLLQATSSRPSEVNRRASFLGVRRGRKSEGATSMQSSPPSSPSKNWRRRASALFAPPLSSSRQQSADDVPTLRGNGLAGRDLPTLTPPLLEHAERPVPARAASGPPVDVFGTAIPLPATPPPPRSEAPTAPPMDRVHTAELEGYMVEEPAVPVGTGVIAPPAVEDNAIAPRAAASAAIMETEGAASLEAVDDDALHNSPALVAPVAASTQAGEHDALKANGPIAADHGVPVDPVGALIPLRRCREQGADSLQQASSDQHEAAEDLATSGRQLEQVETAANATSVEAESDAAPVLPHDEHQIAELSEPIQQPTNGAEPESTILRDRVYEAPVASDPTTTTPPRGKRADMSQSQQAADVPLADPVHGKYFCCSPRRQSFHGAN